MADIQKATATVYLAPTKGRRYFSAKSAAYAEARYIVSSRYYREYGREADHWSADERYNALYSRLALRLLGRFKSEGRGHA